MQLLLGEVQATVDPTNSTGPQVDGKETLGNSPSCRHRWGYSKLFERRTQKVSPKAASLPEADPSHPAVICRHPDPNLPCRASTAQLTSLAHSHFVRLHS